MRSAPVITVPVITLFKLLKYQQLPAAYRTWKPENDRETASFLTGGRNSTLVSTLQVNLSTAVFSCWISTSDGDYGDRDDHFMIIFLEKLAAGAIREKTASHVQMRDPKKSDIICN